MHTKSHVTLLNLWFPRALVRGRFFFRRLRQPEGMSWVDVNCWLILFLFLSLSFFSFLKYPVKWTENRRNRGLFIVHAVPEEWDRCEWSYEIITWRQSPVRWLTRWVSPSQTDVPYGSRYMKSFRVRTVSEGCYVVFGLWKYGRRRFSQWGRGCWRVKILRNNNNHDCIIIGADVEELGKWVCSSGKSQWLYKVLSLVWPTGMNRQRKLCRSQ